MGKTLLLDQTQWDLVLDAEGNWAIASHPYALAQDAASAIRTFLGEVYYDTTQGVPYFQQILGYYPPAQIMKAAFTKAALTVPDVRSATCFLSALGNRQLTGQVQITDATGATAVSSLPFAPQLPPTPPSPPVPPGSIPDGMLDFTDPNQSYWEASRLTSL